MWSFPLFSAHPVVMRRSVILFLILLLLSLLLWLVTWSHGVRHWGGFSLAVLLAHNLLAAAGLGLIFQRNRRSPRFLTNLAFHACLFGWLAWCALPVDFLGGPGSGFDL